MAISTLAQLAAAKRQTLEYFVNGSRTTGAGTYASLFGLTTNVGTGTLAGTSTTTGVVPTDATTGFPVIHPFAPGATGYISRVVGEGAADMRLHIFDLLWKGGAYNFNANTTGNTPASYASRVPNADYKGLQIWVEQVTNATGNQSVSVTYTNQDGTAGRSTGTVVLGSPTAGRIYQMPLQAGDTGVQGVTGVVGTVATAGTFNVLVMRPLWMGRVRMAPSVPTLTNGADNLLMVQVFVDSALYFLASSDTSNLSNPNLLVDIVSG